MKHLLLVLAVFLTATFAISQQRPKARTSLLIDKSRSAVYLTFVRPVQFDTGDKTESSYLIFKVTNNTRWNIWFDMSGGWESMKKVGLVPISLYYAVEDPDKGTVLSGSTSCHVCSVNPLPPGKSIFFPVSESDVIADGRMRLEYDFEWERESNLVDSSSAHYVQYYFSNLPQAILSKLRK
jgi:hypothetical protein